GLILWLQKKNWLYGIVLCTTGLFNIGWAMITGNISAIEFLLFSLSAFLLHRNKINISVFLLGLMAGMKLIPILYLPAFLFLQTDIKNKIATVSWSMLGFLSLPLLSLMTSPHLFPSYLRQLFGLIPNQHTPFSEFTPNGLNPSLSIMLFSFFRIESQPESLNLIFSLIIYAFGIFVLYFIFKSSPKSSGTEINLKLFSVGIILLTIVMPRLKPYSFPPTLLCFYLLSREQSNLIKSAYLILLSIVPTFLHLIYFYTENIDILFENISPTFLANVLQTTLTFHQIVFLSIASILLAIKLNKKVS
ncbi:MAG: glycosyltransferase 87 family protein, partial [Anaerolineales bacterium]